MEELILPSTSMVHYFDDRHIHTYDLRPGSIGLPWPNLTSSPSRDGPLGVWVMTDRRNRTEGSDLRRWFLGVSGSGPRGDPGSRRRRRSPYSPPPPPGDPSLRRQDRSDENGDLVQDVDPDLRPFLCHTYRLGVGVFSRWWGRRKGSGPLGKGFPELFQSFVFRFFFRDLRSYFMIQYLYHSVE